MICNECFSQLNKFDEFQHLAKEIQIKICETIQRTHSEQVTIKQEPIFEYDEESSLLGEGETRSALNENFAEEISYPIYENIEVKMESEEITSILHSKEFSQSEQSDGSDEEQQEDNKAEAPRKSNNEANVGCEKCSKRFKTKIKLNFHMLAEHSGSDGPFECPVCFKIIALKSAFLRHCNIHKQEKKFLCMR